MLVAASIYEACKYFTLFEKTPFKGKCARSPRNNPQGRTSPGRTRRQHRDGQGAHLHTYTELLKDGRAGLA